MEQSKKTIFDQLAVFVYRKWLLIIPVILGTFVGLGVSLKLPERYSSTTLIVVEEQQIPEEYVTPTDRTPFSQRLNVISQQILSRTRLEQIIREFSLYENQGPGVVAKTAAFIKGDHEQLPTKDEVIEQMRQDIQFTVMGETNNRKSSNTGGNAFTITYIGDDPHTTMQVTNTLASLFIEENLKAREQYAEGTSEFLGNELDRSQQELEQLERQLKGFKEAHMGSLPEQLESNLRTLDRLQLDLQNVSGTIKNNEDRRLVLEDQLKFTPSGSPVINSTIAGELERASAELNHLLSMYRESYPDVIIAKKRIAELGRQLEESMKRDKEAGKKAKPSEVMNPAYGELMSVKSQLTTLKQREADIRRQIRDYEKRVEITPASEQQQADLSRDYKIALENYQALLAKKMSARMAENLEKKQKGARFRIIDPANLPQGPDQPDKLMITGFGALGGGALGTGLVFLFEFITPAFRKPEDFDGVLDSPVLASIPLFQLNQNKPEAKFRVIKGRKKSGV